MVRPRFPADQDISSYEATQETRALLKVLALGSREVGAGKVKRVVDAVRRMRAKKTGTRCASKC